MPYRFGEKLRSVRERKGYTLKVVAQKAGVSESLVSQIERNRVSPAIDTLLSLADVLDINLEFLFEEYRRDKPVRIIRKDERRKVEEEDVLYQTLVDAGIYGIAGLHHIVQRHIAFYHNQCAHFLLGHVHASHHDGHHLLVVGGGGIILSGKEVENAAYAALRTYIAQEVAYFVLE